MKRISMTIRQRSTQMLTGICLAAGVFLTACGVIDDDLSDCEKDLHINYHVAVQTNLSDQVQTVLRDRQETAVAQLVEDSLADFFRPYAYDAGLSFYNATGLAHEETQQMNAQHATFDVTLKPGVYRHLALANMARMNRVVAQQTADAATCRLAQTGADNQEGHSSSLFTARKDIDAQGTGEATADVTFYMTNCASVLVIRTDTIKYNDIRVESCDFADGFSVNDSVFSYASNPLIADHRMRTGVPAQREVFYAKTFPSHDTAAAAHARSRADDHQMGADDAERVWRKVAYVTMPDGSITRTVINVRTPLQASKAYIIYGIMAPDGSIHSYNVEVGTSVTLNWKEGLIF